MFKHLLCMMTKPTPKVYATWNPADKAADITLTNGNLKATATTANACSVRANMGKSSGKWYWEINTTDSTANYAGIQNAAHQLNKEPGRSSAAGYGYSWNCAQQSWTALVPTVYGSRILAGNIIGVALDMDAGTIEMFLQGVSQGVMYSGISGTYFPAFGASDANRANTANFGASAFAYSPPAGFNAGIYT